MIELKPCPFCGGEAKFLVKTYKERGVERGYSFGIYCTKCDLVLPRTNYSVEFQLNADGEIEMITDERLLAAEAWNRRADNG